MIIPKSLIEIAVVTVTNHGSNFLDGKGRVPEQNSGSLHSLLQQDVFEGSAGLSGQ